MKARPASLLLVFTLLALLLQPFAAKPTHACTCGPQPTGGQYWNSVEVIVAGTVTEFRVVPPFDAENPNGPYKVQFDFDVNEYLKGSGANSLTLNLPGLWVDSSGDILGGSGGLCELINLHSAGNTFVFFFAGSPTADPGYCNGSRSISSFNDPFLQQIRAALSETPTPTPPPQSPSPPPSQTDGKSITPTVAPSSFPQTGGDPSDSGTGWGTLAVAGALLVALAAGSAWLVARRRGGPASSMTSG